MLLLDHTAVTWSAIHRALQMSETLDAPLLVILALPGGAEGTEPVVVIRHIADLLHARAPRRGFALEVARGTAAEAGLAIVAAASPRLLVVDPDLATHACRIVDDLGIPVLVARDTRARGEWIAASDMRNLNFPVLSTARELAGSLGRELVYVHNARPVQPFSLDPFAGGASFASIMKLQDDAVDAKRSRLEHLANEVRGRCFVTRAQNTVRAVLDVAREREADMLVVGHRPHSWLAHVIGRRTAERVVSDSKRSVLVVPVHGPR